MKDVINALIPLYGQETALDIYQAIKDEIKKEPEHKVADGYQYWYKFINLYTVYPDAVQFGDGKTPLLKLANSLDRIKDLGCNAVHILPFLDSPLKDMGFDVKNYYKIRPDLGTLDDLKIVTKKANELNITLFMDLIFNHVSDQHLWFKKACDGIKYYQDFFIYSKIKPSFIRKFHKHNAVWAEYKVGANKREVNITFPEYAGEIPHFRQGIDGNWYYHTYYPNQMDLNWYNPQVFIELAKVMIYWAKMGFSFRLDAIPFVAKGAYKQTEDTKRTGLIIAALKKIAEKINPSCAFLVETFEELDTVIDYFGTPNQVQANLSYNFHLCSHTWASIVTGDPSFIWNTHKKIKVIPNHAEWINFLRNHDELSLAHMKSDITDKISKEVAPRGLPFREGYGISGRTFSLLGKNIKRFLMAYFLLASLPGGILIPYGDELGLDNIPLSRIKNKNREDTRNINRGKIYLRSLNSRKANFISESIKQILYERNQLKDYLNITPENLEVGKGIFSAIYKIGTSELIVLINLTNKTRKFKSKFKGFRRLSQINNAFVTENLIKLGPYGGVWLQK